jgi:hypothetical protein
LLHGRPLWHKADRRKLVVESRRSLCDPPGSSGSGEIPAIFASFSSSTFVLISRTVFNRILPRRIDLRFLSPATN